VVRGSTANKRVVPFSDFDIEIYGKKKYPVYEIHLCNGYPILISIYFYDYKYGSLLLKPSNVKILKGNYTSGIEEVFENEVFKDKRIQVSVFMSPINVHVTRHPIRGNVSYSKYHPGKYLVAWHPKASEENERTTVVVENETFGKVLYRQIAGALARRIVNYASQNSKVEQGADSGFIKFGSRVDLFLPLDADIKVALNQKVRGGESVIAEIK
jgi:phosphatidylserine decarboxylase precursor-related protein